MRARRLPLALVASALALGCDDPAASLGASPDLAASRSDRSEWQLVADLGTIPESEGLPFYISCLNGGQGEVALVFGGPYLVYMKTLVTPSGNVINQGWIRTEYEGYRGTESGDLWEASFEAKYREFTRQADGHLLLFEPFSEVMTNAQTGERVRIQAMYRIEFDEDFNVVNSNVRWGEIFACHAWK
jgi:hypothetical protein